MKTSATASASNFPGLAIPKPEPRKRAKRRADRVEATVKRIIRELCVERDGYCLIASRLVGGVRVLLGPCDGPSEWAHIGKARRCFTRGQAPAKRHTTAGSGMLCERHHRAYDAHAFDITPDPRVGMDGVFGIVRRAA